MQGAGGTTTCECGVDTAGDAPPLDYSTKEEKTDAGSVYFKNLTEPPDLSRAVVMIYALLALLGACVAAHAYGRRLDARDARRLACPDAKTLKYSSSACKLHADDDPYEAHGDYDVLMAGWKRNFFHAMDLGHPFYGWYTLYSASVPRGFRASSWTSPSSSPTRRRGTSSSSPSSAGCRAGRWRETAAPT